MRILGVHAVGHDAGAAVIDDGMVMHSIEVERLTRRRFDHRVDLAIDHMLSRPDVDLDSIDVVALSTPIGHPSLDVIGKEAVMGRLAGRQDLHAETTCMLRGRRIPCMVVTHEVCHAMLAIHQGGYQDHCLVLVNEGRGQFSQNAVFEFRGGELEWLASDVLPWYGRGLGWTGLGVLFGMGNSPGAAGKLMAMSGYGQYEETIADRLREITDNVTTDHVYANEVAEALVREGFTDGFERRADVMATFQRMFSKSVVGVVRRTMTDRQCQALSIGGGCGLNIVTNTVLRNECGLNPAIAPACNDSGHPLGAAAYAWWKLAGKPLEQFSVYVNGESESSASIAEAFKAARMECVPLDLDHVATTLASGGIVAFHRGAAESGPRALGHRSILANPSVPGMRERVSERLKTREWYRPLAAVVTDESLGEFLPGQLSSPHMLFDYQIPPGVMPEARHVNGTSRLQTVSVTQEPCLHELLTTFTSMTGVPGLINTSLNAAGRAIAQTTDDMLTDFLHSQVDLFVADDCMARQPS